jgi:hypothetical protein
LATESAHEEEVADIHAPDQQHDADDDHEQRRPQADEAPAAWIWDPTESVPPQLDGSGSACGPCSATSCASMLFNSADACPRVPRHAGGRRP